MVATKVLGGVLDLETNWPDTILLGVFPYVESHRTTYWLSFGTEGLPLQDWHTYLMYDSEIEAIAARNRIDSIHDLSYEYQARGSSRTVIEELLREENMFSGDSPLELKALRVRMMLEQLL